LPTEVYKEEAQEYYKDWEPINKPKAASIVLIKVYTIKQYLYNLDNLVIAILIEDIIA
jgi:hypothetical protein